nr:hypothetical protein [Candidatus Sigynarchaeota archaeon]
MKKKDEIDSKATFEARKARQLLAEGKRNKAAKKFVTAADLFEQIATISSDHDAWKLVADNLLAAAQVLVEDEEFGAGARMQRRLASVYLHMNDFKTAADYYNVATKFALKDPKGDPVFILIVAGMYAFLTFIEAEHEKAREFLKRVLGMFDADRAKDKLIYDLLRVFFKGTNDTKLESGSNPVADGKQCMKEGLLPVEIDAINLVLNVRKLADDVKITFSIESPKKKEKILEGDDIAACISIDLDVGAHVLPELTKIASHATIAAIIVEKSNALSLVSKFDLPATVPLGKSIALQEVFRSYNAGDNEIGPVLIEMRLGTSITIKKTLDSRSIKIHGQPVAMDVEYEPLQEPLVGKPFPLRIDVLNKSRGDASDLEIEVQIPEDLPIRLVRGTLKKKFFRLNAGDATSWEIQLRPDETGTFVLNVVLNYKDGDGHPVGPVINTMPIEIKM